MTVVELKRWIYKNEKIQQVLENIGCHHILFHSAGGYYTCANPDGDNNAAITVYVSEYLNCRNYTRKIGDDIDLIDLVKFIRKTDFKQTILWLHKLFGLDTSYKKVVKKQVDPLRVFKKVGRSQRRINTEDIIYLNEDILSDFIPHIHIDLFREGIISKTIDKFELGYSYKYKRTIFPYRYWLNGELLGYTGRTSVKNNEIFNIPKYWIYSGYQKNLNLYGLWENYQSIQNNSLVTIFESEKSVLKRHSRNDETGVALSGHEISDEQVKIIIGLDIDEVVIALDKDIDINEVRNMCEKFYHIRKVSYIYDKYDLIGDKDSPADAPNKIYEFLFKHRILYNEKEHREYVKSLDRRK